MDNAMTTKDKATEIANYIVDLEKRIKLWQDLMAQRTGRSLAEVESAFERQLSQPKPLQNPVNAQDYHADLLQRVQSANTDTECTLISILHEGLFRRSQPDATL